MLAVRGGAIILVNAGGLDKISYIKGLVGGSGGGGRGDTVL